MENEQIVGPKAHETARRKARYGRRDWLWWIGRDGKQYAAPKTPDSIKSAMLARGTQGEFLILGANDGAGMIADWATGCIMLRNARIGY